MVAVDPLDPLPVVMLGSTRVVVDAARPVAAVIEAGGAARVVTWADAPLPARAASGHVLAAPGCVWVIYSEDFAGDDLASTTTAVRIGADATVGWCELGALEVAGVDEVGVWTTAHPYLAMAGSREEMPGADLFQPAPEWLADAPVVSWEDFEREQEAAGRADVAASMAAAAASGQKSTGWFAFSPDAARQPPAGPPPAPVATSSAVLRRVRPGGAAQEMTVSRVVSQVIAPAPGALRVVFHPTTAVITNTPEERVRTYDHPRRTVVIDVSGGLPAQVDLDALAWQPTVDELPAWEPRQTRDRVELVGIAATRWTLRDPGRERAEAAVAAVVEQYTALDASHAVHTRRDDRWHRVASRYADVVVRVEGAWPAAVVIVDFTYQGAPGRLLRRRTPVFDEVGVPIADPHLTIHLGEDLNDADLDQPPVIEGRCQI